MYIICYTLIMLVTALTIINNHFFQTLYHSGTTLIRETSILKLIKITTCHSFHYIQTP